MVAARFSPFLFRTFNVLGTPMKSAPLTTPLTTVASTECTAPPSGRRACCPECQKTFNAGAVLRQPSRFDVDLGGQVSPVTMYCDHCNVLVKGDIVNGTVVGTPIVIRSRRRIAQFLTAHPEARGVQQSC